MKIWGEMIALALVAGGAWGAKVPAPETLIAHRGESYDAPENTLPAYKMAVARGFGFECDIYLSSDRQLFTFHDGDLSRTTGGACRESCTKASWAETISKVNVGAWGKWKGSAFDPTPPAHFSEVLALARPERKIYVEVKGNNAQWVPFIKEAVEKEPKATPETILFISFGDALCKELKKQMPEYKVYYLKPAMKDARNQIAWSPEEIIADLRRLNVDGIDICYSSQIHTADFIAKVHAAGYEFHVWTIDDPAQAAEAFARGVDTLTTNRAQHILESWQNGK